MSEPVNLILRWRADRVPDTVHHHKVIADREGAAWWGKLTSSPLKPGMPPARVDEIASQLGTGTPTHVYLVGGETVWRADLVSISLSALDVDDTRKPGYYELSDCHLFVELADFRPLSLQWALDNLVLQSRPHEPISREALLGRPSLMYVYERRGPWEGSGGLPVGKTYRREDDTKGVSSLAPSEIDSDRLDRGVKGHKRTQNLLADHLESKGLEAMSPVGGGPPFDVAWWDGDTFWLAEVKSLTPDNERHQIRYAIGQVLDYASQVAKDVDLRKAIVTETRPSSRWVALCNELGIAIAWPGELNRLEDDS